MYYKNGQEILAPYNVTCEFKFFRTEQRPIDGQLVPIPFSMFETHSKKEMKFIEESPTYGILISEHFSNVVKTTTTTEITRLETTLQRVQQMTNEELYVQAAKYQIPEGIGPDEIRNKIAWKLAKQEMESEDSLQKSRIQDAAKETVLFKSSNVV